MSKALPSRSSLLVFVLAAALVLAGCVKQDKPPADNVGAATTNSTPLAPSNATANATANVNASTGTNGTGKDPNMPSDPSSCMSGMDMPGCTMAQADYYYKHSKAGSAAPDRALPPVVVALDPQGAGQSGKFTVENATQQLLISIKIKDDGPGPYAALGPGGQGDLAVELKGPASTKKIMLNGTTQSVGVDPASTLFKSFVDGLVLPGEGSWTIQVDGQGKAVTVEIDITERFYL
jgi:hypothetical protein